MYPLNLMKSLTLTLFLDDRQFLIQLSFTKPFMASAYYMSKSWLIWWFWCFKEGFLIFLNDLINVCFYYFITSYIRICPLRNANTSRWLFPENLKLRSALHNVFPGESSLLLNGWHTCIVIQAIILIDDNKDTQLYDFRVHQLTFFSLNLKSNVRLL